ncbi:unnamed protein product [Brachionus calyciflorus]|uniref:Uncharacterized protein n=1 Tax=Brachionus calyciflorus TaxID=104777 RepID=A0A814MML6_9BILA|nr:unnamed protein product [Brachionus calyciflorus]
MDPDSTRTNLRSLLTNKGLSISELPHCGLVRMVCAKGSCGTLAILCETLRIGGIERDSNEELHKKSVENDKESKRKSKSFNDKRHKIRNSTFKVGDSVLHKWRRFNKSDTLYDPDPYVIKSVNGSMITITRGGKELTRNSSFLKKYNTPSNFDRSQSETKEDLKGEQVMEKSESSVEGNYEKEPEGSETD